jgi:ABC-type amino acid transport system permease subunit
VFLFANVSWFAAGVAGLVGLTLYSFGPVGEVLRSFLTAYPKAVADQARLMGMSPMRDWLQLRMPWTLWRSWTALITHWVSLLKDTGALVVLGIGELTTTAKVLSEVAASFEQWGNHLDRGGRVISRRYPGAHSIRALRRRQAIQDPATARRHRVAS